MHIAITENAWSPFEEARTLPTLGVVDGVCVSFQRLESSMRTRSQTLFTRARAKKRLLGSYDKKIPLLECVADTRHGNLETQEGRASLVARFERAIQVASEMEAEAITLIGPSLRRTTLFRPHTFQEDWGYLSHRANEYGVGLVLEPSPRIYATRFWYSAELIDGFMAASNSPGSVGLDTTALAFEDNPRSVLAQYAAQASVFTVSEPGQAPLAARGPVPHRRMATDLGRLKAAGRAPKWLSLRYRRPENGAIEVVQSCLDRLRIIYASPLRV